METIGYVLLQIVVVFKWMLIARALMSWFVKDRGNPVYRFVSDITDVYLDPIREFLAKLGVRPMMFDISFIVGYFVVLILEGMLRSI